MSRMSSDSLVPITITLESIIDAGTTSPLSYCKYCKPAQTYQSFSEVYVNSSSAWLLVSGKVTALAFITKGFLLAWLHTQEECYRSSRTLELLQAHRTCMTFTAGLVGKMYYTSSLVLTLQYMVSHGAVSMLADLLGQPYSTFIALHNPLMLSLFYYFLRYFVKS